jgi:hypothetical protein
MHFSAQRHRVVADIISDYSAQAASARREWRVSRPEIGDT